MMWGELGAILTVFLIGAQIAPLSGKGLKECSKVEPQKLFDFNLLTGVWYAVETVIHNTAVEPNTVSTVTVTCPKLELKLLDNTTIRLEWNENAGALVYEFRQSISAVGVWHAVGNQTGSLVKRRREQFSGTVKVMKAVRSHMVLTFCSYSKDITYSVLMSRTRRLPPSERRSVNDMLTKRGLQQGHVTEMCKGDASATRVRLVVFTLILVAKFLIAWP